MNIKFGDIKPGRYNVERDCCTSGNCIECNGKTPVGTKMRVVQIGNVDKKTADIVAENFKAYNAKVVSR